MTALISLALVHATTHPSEAMCPVGFYVEGVRPNGVTRCIQVPAHDVCNTRGGCDSVAPLVSVPLRVWCSAGQHAVVVDERRIACR